MSSSVDDKRGSICQYYANKDLATLSSVMSDTDQRHRSRGHVSASAIYELGVETEGPSYLSPPLDAVFMNFEESTDIENGP